MGDHEASELVLPHDAFREIQDLVRCGRVEGRRVLVEKEELWLVDRGHEEGQGLPLPAG